MLCHMGFKCGETPGSILRQLREEAHYGCSRCGNPLLNNAHVICSNNNLPASPENMLSLCFACHKLADGGEFPEKSIRELKGNPYNKDHISERFMVEGHKLIVNLGGNRYINAPKILTVNDFEILTIKMEPRGYLAFNLSLFDKYNNLVGVVDENKWAGDKTLEWELEYKSKHLKISNDARKVSFTMEIRNDEIYLRGDLYFASQPIRICDDGLWIEERSIFSNMKGCTFEENTGDAINYQLKTNLL